MAPLVWPHAKGIIRASEKKCRIAHERAHCRAAEVPLRHPRERIRQRGFEQQAEKTVVLPGTSRAADSLQHALHGRAQGGKRRPQSPKCAAPARRDPAHSGGPKRTSQMGCAKQLIPRPTGSTATADRRSTCRMQRGQGGLLAADPRRCDRGQRAHGERLGRRGQEHKQRIRVRVAAVQKRRQPYGCARPLRECGLQTRLKARRGPVSIKSDSRPFKTAASTSVERLTASDPERHRRGRAQKLAPQRAGRFRAAGRPEALPAESPPDGGGNNRQGTKAPRRRQSSRRTRRRPAQAGRALSRAYDADGCGTPQTVPDAAYSRKASAMPP